MRWHPSVTVASVIERDGKFLFVEERRGDSSELVLNQPAGHWENGESLWDAARRETMEETGWMFTPTHLLGIYQWRQDASNTFLRFAFTGHLGEHDPERPLDDGIIRALWLTPDELAAQAQRHRSPLVMHCVRDYLAGIRLSLEGLRVIA